MDSKRTDGLLSPALPPLALLDSYWTPISLLASRSTKARNRAPICLEEVVGSPVHQVSQRRVARLIPIERMILRYEHTATRRRLSHPSSSRLAAASATVTGV
jgi:hypothetical protein